MNNPRITSKERNLIKGSIRRAFSRSELRKQILNRTIVKDYTDISRPRVKTWCRCELCGALTPKSYIEIDHIQPVIELGKQFLVDVSSDEFINNLWSESSNLQGICETCHDKKTSIERKIRTTLNRAKKLKNAK